MTMAIHSPHVTEAAQRLKVKNLGSCTRKKLNEKLITKEPSL